MAADYYYYTGDNNNVCCGILGTYNGVWTYGLSGYGHYGGMAAETGSEHYQFNRRLAGNDTGLCMFQRCYFGEGFRTVLSYDDDYRCICNGIHLLYGDPLPEAGCIY